MMTKRAAEEACSKNLGEVGIDEKIKSASIDNENNNSTTYGNDRREHTQSLASSRELEQMKMSACSVPSMMLLSPSSEFKNPRKAKRKRRNNRKTLHFKTLESVESMTEECCKEYTDREYGQLQNSSLSGSNNTTGHILPMLSNLTAPSLPGLLTSPLIKSDKNRSSNDVQVHWLDDEPLLNFGYSRKSNGDANLGNAPYDLSTLTNDESPNKRPLTLLERRQSNRAKVTELSGLCMEAIASPTELVSPTLTTSPHVTFRGWAKSIRPRKKLSHTSVTSLHRYGYSSENPPRNAYRGEKIDAKVKRENTNTTNNAESLENINNIYWSEDRKGNFDLREYEHQESQTSHASSSRFSASSCNTITAKRSVPINECDFIENSNITNLNKEKNSVKYDGRRSCTNSCSYSNNNNSTAIRVVCYNILADRLVNTDRYRSCPLQALNEEYRIGLIKEEVQLASPDIFIAEEMSESVFHNVDSLGDYLEKTLHMQGELVTITDVYGNPHHRAIDTELLSRTWEPAEWEREPKLTNVEVKKLYTKEIVTNKSINESSTENESDKNHTISINTISTGENIQSKSNAKTTCDSVVQEFISENIKSENATEDVIKAHSQSNNDHDSSNNINDRKNGNDCSMENDCKNACDAMCDRPLRLTSFIANKSGTETVDTNRYDNNNVEENLSKRGNVSDFSKGKTISKRVENGCVDYTAASESNDTFTKDCGFSSSPSAVEGIKKVVVQEEAKQHEEDEQDESMFRSEMDGVAIFFRTDRFTLLEKVPIYFNRIATLESQLLTPYERRKLRVNSHNVALVCVLQDRLNSSHIYLVAAVHLIWHREECQLWQCHHLLSTLEQLKHKYTSLTMTTTGSESSPVSTSYTHNWEEQQQQQCNNVKKNGSLLNTKWHDTIRKQIKPEENWQNRSLQQSLIAKMELYRVTCIIGGDFNVEKNTSVFSYLQRGVIPENVNVFQFWHQWLQQTQTNNSNNNNNNNMGNKQICSEMITQDLCSDNEICSTHTSSCEHQPSMTAAALQELEQTNADREYWEEEQNINNNYEYVDSKKKKTVKCVVPLNANDTSLKQHSPEPWSLAVHTPINAHNTNFNVNIAADKEVNKPLNTPMAMSTTTTATANNNNNKDAEELLLSSGYDGEEYEQEYFQSSQLSALSNDIALHTSGNTPTFTVQQHNKSYSRGKAPCLELPSVHSRVTQSMTPTKSSNTPILNLICTESNQLAQTQNANTTLALLLSASPNPHSSVDRCHHTTKLNKEHCYKNTHNKKSNANITTTSSTTSTSPPRRCNANNNSPHNTYISKSLSLTSKQNYIVRRHRSAASHNTSQTQEIAVKREGSSEMEVVGHSLLRSPQPSLLLPSPSPSLSHRISARNLVPSPVTPTNVVASLSRQVTLPSPLSISSSTQTPPAPSFRRSHHTLRQTITTRAATVVPTTPCLSSTYSLTLAESQMHPQNIEPNVLHESTLSSTSSFTPHQKSMSEHISPQLLPASIYMSATERADSINTFSDTITSPSETPTHNTHAEYKQQYHDTKSYPSLIKLLLPSQISQSHPSAHVPSSPSTSPSQSTSSSPHYFRNYNISTGKTSEVVNNVSREANREYTLQQTSSAERCDEEKSFKSEHMLHNGNNNSDEYHLTSDDAACEKLKLLEKVNNKQHVNAHVNDASHVESTKSHLEHRLSFSDAYASYCRRHHSKVSAVQPPSMNEGKVIDHILFEDNFVTCTAVLRLGDATVMPSATIPSDHYMIGAILVPTLPSSSS